MKTVNVHEAKTHLSRLLKLVERGEEIVIARNGQPVARLKSYSGEMRRPGSLKGQITIRNDFDAPLPESILRGFQDTE